tara:strand:+ start:1178 stop:1327 length:150 start_codon:yes stop_codon:yes gene_type:complete
LATAKLKTFMGTKPKNWEPPEMQKKQPQSEKLVGGSSYLSAEAFIKRSN